jgi:ectoine hydroxylase-related dioxygenase (phytanoyl-CoA dioxygenase family)
MKWFEENGCKLIKTPAEPGDLIIWDSRTTHYASLPKSEAIRTVIYATYTPARLATPEDLETKAEIFGKYEVPTHWPRCDIFGQGSDAEWKDLSGRDGRAS